MTDVVTRTTLRGVPKPKPSTKRSFRIADDLYAQAQLAAEFNEEYVTDAITSNLDRYVKATQRKPGYAEWLAAREEK